MYNDDEKPQIARRFIDTFNDKGIPFTQEIPALAQATPAQAILIEATRAEKVEGIRKSSSHEELALSKKAKSNERE